VLEGDHKHKYDEGGYDYRSDHSTYSQDDNERPVLKPAEKNGSGELGHFDHNANYHLGCTECTAPSHEFSDRSWYARDEYAERRPAPRDMYASPAAPDPYAAGEEDDKPRAPGTAAAKLAQTDDVYAAYPPEPAHDGWLRRLFRKMKV
jgi:hypothetical protein